MVIQLEFRVTNYKIPRGLDVIILCSADNMQCNFSVAASVRNHVILHSIPALVINRSGHETILIVIFLDFFKQNTHYSLAYDYDYVIITKPLGYCYGNLSKES